MIDSYGEHDNPCTFCAEEVGNDKNENECLEFSLCGNNTTLIVREVSVENLTNSKEDRSITDEPTEIPAFSISKKTLSSSPEPTRSAKKSSLTKLNQRIETLFTKKWSGHTYFEEEIRRLRDIQYEKDVKEALKLRKLWRSFQIDINKDRKLELVKSSGPEWWQEPSPKQIVLATTLKDVIKADFEEEVTGRTRQWLLDLGVVTRLTPNQVRRCMKRSLLEPVDFLLEAHAQLVKSQQCIKKKRDLQRPFSVDERLLLTAVCVLQLPTLLTMLHYLLPPPKPFPVDKFALELLYGDLNDEAIRYSTPYMEPLPFRNRIDFEDWAFGKICSALLPILIQSTVSAKGVKKSNLSEKITSDLKESLSFESQHRTQTNRVSVYSRAPSVALLLCYCLSKRNESGSMKGNVDDESVIRRKTFDRRLTCIRKNQSHFKVTDLSKVEQTELPIIPSLGTVSVIAARETNSSVKKVPTLTVSSPEEQSWPYQSQQNWNHQPSSVFPNQPQPTSLQSAWANQAWQAEYNQPLQPNNYVYPYSDPAYYDDYANYYETPEGGNTQDKSQKVKSTEIESSKTSSKQSLEVSQDKEEANKGADKEGETNEALNQLKNIWNEISSYPEKEQLQKAIKVLKEMGDPLAQLPKIHKLPTIQRWLELRRGKNRILSKATKRNLMLVSRDMWRCVGFGKSNRGPKVDMPKSEERKLTWDRKKWLESEVKKEKLSYFSRVRQEKVDNARAYFPTMLNHYDHGSRLNRNFRDVYFTYLPSREVDTIAYRPWKPQETRNSNT